MRNKKRNSSARPVARSATLLAVSAWLVVSGCGGGGGSSSAPPPAATTRVAGSVYGGPIVGADVVVKDGTANTIAGPTPTGAGGAYLIDVPTSALAGSLTFESSGGVFTDEATRASTAGGRLAALVPAGTLGPGSTVHLTPASTILENLVTRHGRSRVQASNALGAAFAFTPDLGVGPANAPAAQASLASRVAGLRAAAFSRLAHDLGLAAGAQFDLLAALAEDLADGSLDGAKSSTPVALGGEPLPEDVQNRFERAFTEFLGSAADLTGLHAGQIGFLPFGKVALTDTWRVEYVPSDPGAALGETPFRLRITRRAAGSAAAGLSVTLAPVMHMESQVHGTPAAEAVDNGDGTYGCAVYYSMAGGDPYGYWSLGVTIDDGRGAESATFYPTVGTPSYATLWGVDDRVDGGAKRLYYLFDAGLVEEDPTRGTYGFSLFVAAREDDADFPALAEGLELHDETGAAWKVAAVVVEVSLDRTVWIPAVPSGSGRWSVAGLTGIDPNSEQLTFYVRLTVDGERKTADGQVVAGDGANGHAALMSGGASCCD